MKSDKSIRLTKEERDWEAWILSGKAKQIKNFVAVKKALLHAARAQREKTKLVSIRVRTHDLERLRARAEREGLPYQTLINSLIHKYANSEYSE